MSMEFTLNDLQRRRVEDHLALVEQVLRRSIKTNETVDGMGYLASHRYRDRHSRTHPRTDASPPAAGGVCPLAAVVALDAGSSALAQ